MIRLFTISILLFSIILPQDTRYLDEIFDEVIKIEDVVYGNAPDLPFWFWVESNTNDIDLDMDVYEPAGDTITNRPVIIFVHTGSFFSGHNELDDVVDLAISAAKRGYVAVSINYRLGLNVLSTYSGERAVYRAVQDGGAAIRYLREFPEEFGINPDQIFMWGTSAGSLVALHLSYLDDDDRPDATYGGGDDPDLGCPICEGNDYAHDPKPNAIVSCWGAVGLLDWIDADDTVPAIMFHGTLDPIVPFNSGFPFTLDIALPIVYGSNLIHDRLDEVGIENELYAESGLLHEYWGTVNGNWFGGPNEYFYQIQTDAYSFLYNYLDCAQQDPLSLCLVAEGGLNEVFLQWEPNALAESYNIYRDGELVGSTSSNDFIDGQQGGWGLGYDVEYCYTITTIDSSGNEGMNSGEACATTLPVYQVFLQIDTSLANVDIAAVDSPFGDLTGDGNIDAVIMVKMVNFVPVNGYQFNFSMDPGIVDAIITIDGTNKQFEICILEAIEVGMDESVAIAYCEDIGYSSGLQAQMSAPGSSGVVMGFDINGEGYIPAGYPGDGGAEGNLLALLVLDSEYTGPGDEVAVTVSDFVVSGINPFTGGYVSLAACDADLDPFNGCFDISSFSTPIADCAGIPGGDAVVDECGECGGDGSPCFPFGDINFDNNVDVLDVVLQVNGILQPGSLTSEQELAADVSGDGVLNIIDVVLLVNIILSDVSIERIQEESGYSYQCHPDEVGIFPIVLYNHGGLGQSIGGDLLNTCKNLAESGYLARSEKRQETITLEGHLDEVVFALNNLKNHEKADSSSIGVIGFSRGGLLSLQASIIDNSIDALVLLAPATGNGLVYDIFDSFGEISSSVLIQISENDSSPDDLVSVSYDIYSTMLQSDIDVEIIEYPPFDSNFDGQINEYDDGHQLFFTVQEPYWSDLTNFLSQELGGR